MVKKMDSLESMRKSIDNIDNAIIAMYAERFRITNKIGLYKAENNLPAKDEQRESTQFQRVTELAAAYGLDETIARQILEKVIDCVVQNHRQIAENFRSS